MASHAPGLRARAVTERRGLGRGLAAILRSSTGGSDDQAGVLHTILVDASLATLAGRRSLHLCGYVHQPREPDAQVRLRIPNLAALHPSAAYQLFTAVARAATDQATAGTRRRPRPMPLALNGTKAFAVRTTGPGSEGVFFFADPLLDDPGAAELARFCEAFAPVIHEHDRAPGPDEHPRLVIDQTDDTAYVEVELRGRSGFGSAASAREAVAVAALAAVAERVKLVRLDPIQAASSEAALVVASGEDGRLGLGAAPLGTDALTAVAVAASRVARRLRD